MKNTQNIIPGNGLVTIHLHGSYIQTRADPLWDFHIRNTQFGRRHRREANTCRWSKNQIPSELPLTDPSPGRSVLSLKKTKVTNDNTRTSTTHTTLSTPPPPPQKKKKKKLK